MKSVLSGALLYRSVYGPYMEYRGAADLLKAANTVWNRMLDRYSPIAPETIMAITAEEIQKCGMSNRKANYIKGIAEAVVQGS